MLQMFNNWLETTQDDLDDLFIVHSVEEVEVSSQEVSSKKLLIAELEV